MTKIYFQENPLFLYTPSNLSKNCTTLSLDIHQKDAVQKLMSEMEQGIKNSGALHGTSLTEILENLYQFYTPITAAGGLIEHADGSLLFIYRRGKWDLPKGKMDEGETALETAVREIEEETGVRGLELISPLPDSFHVYEAFEKKWLKTTHWFHFITAFEGKLIPQTQEDITEIRWVKKEDLHFVKENTYPAILDLLE